MLSGCVAYKVSLTKIIPKCSHMDPPIIGSDGGNLNCMLYGY